MAKQVQNNIKLGAFVLTGLLLLVLLLYLLGRNQNLFGRTFTLKTSFDNIQGLVAGNNVRYAGIQVGTVKKIQIINDTLIEISMMVDEEMKNIIRSNATASIGTDGLMGNKLVNITPAQEPGSPIQNNDLIGSKSTIDTDDMLRVLSKTNSDVAQIAAELKLTIMQINNSRGLWTLLNDNRIPASLSQAVNRANRSMENITVLTSDVRELVTGIKQGRGSIGKLLTDTAMSSGVQATLGSFHALGRHADSMLNTVHETLAGLQRDVRNGKGAINSLLNDTLMVVKLNNSLDNIEKGTAGFNENMEALKGSFLFRGYFRRLEKQRAIERKLDVGRNHGKAISP